MDFFTTFTLEQTNNNKMEFDREDCLSTISDLYKSAYGIRPRGYDFASWSSDELEKFENDLVVICKREEEEEAKHDATLREAFRKLVTETIALGAGDRKTALRWIAEGEEMVSGWDVEGFMAANGFVYYSEEWKALGLEFDEVLPVAEAA